MSDLRVGPGSSGSQKRPPPTSAEDEEYDAAATTTDADSEMELDGEWRRGKEERKKEKREKRKKKKAEEQVVEKTGTVTAAAPAPAPAPASTPAPTAAPTQSHPTSAKVPAIYVYETDFATIVAELKPLCRTKAIFSFRVNHLIARAATSDDWKAITTYLAKKNIQFYTYTMQNCRPIKAILKYLPPSMKPEDIMEDLKSKGLDAKRVVNLKRRDGTASSVFMVVAARTLAETLYKVDDVRGIRVTVSPFKPRQGPPRCLRCQRFGHSSECCTLAIRCSRCGQGHGTSECTLSQDATRRCANCAGEHPASYRGCPVFQRLATGKQSVQAGQVAPKPTPPPPPPRTEKAFPKLPSMDSQDAELINSQNVRKWAELRMNPKSSQPQPSTSGARPAATPAAAHAPVARQKVVATKEAAKKKEKKIREAKKTEERKEVPTKKKRNTTGVSKSEPPLSIDSDEEVTVTEMLSSFRFLQTAARKAAIGIRKLNKIANPMEKLAFFMELATSIFES